jgi:hypothetical protein
MTIHSATPPKFTDNFRKKKRLLQGRGVNLRMILVDASATPYAAGNRIPVPGMHADDDIIGLINWTDGLDASGYISEAGVKAFHEYLASDARFTVTALQPGTDGDNIFVQIARKGDASETVLASQPLSVAIGPYDQTLIANGVDIDSSGHAGDTLILVMLATDATGTAITTDPNGPNSTVNVVAAILDAQEALVQDAFVDVAIKNDNGEDPATATGPTALGSGAEPFFQGAVAAELITDLDAPYASPYDEVRYVARTPGAAGNEITVEYVSGSPANGIVSVTVVSGDVVLTDAREIVVTYQPGVCTVQQAVDAVNAHAVAGALVVASLWSENPDGSGFLSAMAETALSGGLDPSIALSVAAPVKLLVLWLTKEN